MTADVSQSLCTSCGLCCNGTLFASVTVDEPSLAAARRAGLPMVESAGRTTLQLPCPALRDNMCSIYGEHPQQCAEYNCGLLVRLARGKVSLDRARDSIAKVRRQVARITAQLPERSTPWWLWRRSTSDEQRAELSCIRGNAELLRDVDSLAQRLRRDFWG